MSKEKSNNLKEVKEKVLYTKKQIIQSEIFKDRKDLLNVLIKDDESLALDDVNNRIDKFMKGGVK